MKHFIFLGGRCGAAPTRRLCTPKRGDHLLAPQLVVPSNHHRQSSPRSKLLLAEPTVMRFTAKCRTLSYHMGLRSIFFCFYKDQKSGALFMHASLRIPSVIQDPCSEGCCYLFPSMEVLLFCYAKLMVNAVFLYAFRWFGEWGNLLVTNPTNLQLVKEANMNCQGCLIFGHATQRSFMTRGDTWANAIH